MMRITINVMQMFSLTLLLPSLTEYLSINKYNQIQT